MDQSILLDAVTDRLTEAFAELIHLKMRKELWGHAPDEDLSLDDLLKVTKDDGERDSFRRREIYRFSVSDHSGAKTVFKACTVSSRTLVSDPSC